MDDEFEMYHSSVCTKNMRKIRINTPGKIRGLREGKSSLKLRFSGKKNKFPVYCRGILLVSLHTLYSGRTIGIPNADVVAGTQMAINYCRLTQEFAFQITILSASIPFGRS